MTEVTQQNDDSLGAFDIGTDDAEEQAGFDLGSDLGVQESGTTAPVPGDSSATAPAASQMSAQSHSTDWEKLSPDQFIQADPSTLTPEAQKAQAWIRNYQGVTDRNFNQLRGEVEQMRTTQAPNTAEAVGAAVKEAMSVSSPEDPFSDLRQQMRGLHNYQEGDDNALDLMGEVVNRRLGTSLDEIRVQQNNVNKVLGGLAAYLVQNAQAQSSSELNDLHETHGQDQVNQFVQGNQASINTLKKSVNPRTQQNFTTREAVLTLSGWGDDANAIAIDKRARNGAKNMAGGPLATAQDSVANGGEITEADLLAAVQQQGFGQPQQF